MASWWTVGRSQRLQSGVNKARTDLPWPPWAWVGGGAAQVGQPHVGQSQQRKISLAACEEENHEDSRIFFLIY